MRARALLWQRATVLEQRLHVAAIEPLEHDGDALRVADDWRLLKRHDSRVAQRAQQLDLHAQRVEDLGVLERRPRHHLERDRRLRFAIHRAEDLRHRASAELVDKLEDALNVVDIAPDARDVMPKIDAENEPVKIVL